MFSFAGADGIDTFFVGFGLGFRFRFRFRPPSSWGCALLGGWVGGGMVEGEGEGEGVLVCVCV